MTTSVHCDGSISENTHIAAAPAAAVDTVCNNADNTSGITPHYADFWQSWKTPGELGVSKSREYFDTVGWVTGKGIRPVKN